ncbi:MAG: TIGR00730 family Rossman fold protein [Flavobacteriales bacterium]|nr:TIGR00730 family Rossman fold protein [Flavobacteriales bacterium]HQV39210.1 TIGR00730 family Rossman fold protein [Flavobacteriales bacterium]HQW32344.1 TIGR00730 family Rossman fold protein [Flavobacteriales bacterium]HQY03507.1 TIGR00730 family Rossman fold protein [Flavobacteriales bacterium]HQY79879.1 TIGR00730 family Rossman fold protein [Flavobacteriales bacterium]
MKSIVVFCGSSAGHDPEFLVSAKALGATIASRGARLIYGGAKVGLMGCIADAALAQGSEVIGILPRFLSIKEVAHEGLTQLLIVENMHERKTKMFELGDAFIAMPGGFGTLEELFEVVTWAQLGLHQKPIGVLNVNGFYDPLMAQLDHMVSKGLLKQRNRDLIMIDSAVDGLLAKMEAYEPVPEKKWISDLDQV